MSTPFLVAASPSEAADLGHSLHFFGGPRQIRADILVVSAAIAFLEHPCKTRVSQLRFPLSDLETSAGKQLWMLLAFAQLRAWPAFHPGGLTRPGFDLSGPLSLLPSRHVKQRQERPPRADGVAVLLCHRPDDLVDMVRSWTVQVASR
jgi:hypothetical protein